MATWSVPAFLDALKTQLEARGGLSGVEIFTAHPGDGITPVCIVFHTIRGRQEPGRSGPSNDEEYICEGFIYVERAGAGEAHVKTVRDAADTVLNEMEAQLTTDENVNSTVGYARLGAFDFFQGSHDADEVGMRWARIDFEINVIAIL